MVCEPGSNNINIPSPGPGPSIPGLGLPFSVPKIPFPDVKLPAGIPEDIIDLVERIFALFPQGIKFTPNADALTKGIWDVLASLFNQLAPFLGLYKFIQALLNIILCIIDVLCALFNPWATVKALNKLFKQCLPDFLSLFPWIALLIMILAMILLLIELIKYIIDIIVAYIKQIIENIKILTRSISVGDADSILAAVNKLSYLICLIEQLFAIFLAIAALFAVIKPLMDIFGRGVCQRGSSGGCCTEDFCPAFIADLPDGQSAGSGRLIYQREIIVPIPGDPAFSFLNNVNLPALRNERWQFVDNNPGEYSFLNIITPSPEYGFTYWPEGESYDSSANVIRVPYLVDMNVSLDPANFGNPSDTEGLREFYIRDIIVSQKPTHFPTAWNNTTDTTAAASGSLQLLGGKVYEYADDGYTAYQINGTQATLETLISQNSLVSDEIPPFDDGYDFINISYNLRYNHEVLIQKELITAMCQPDLAIESAIFNAEFNDTRSVIEKVGDLPDIGTLNTNRTDGTGTLGCLARALTKFRKNLNEESALVFQEEALACLNSLLADSEDFYCRGVAETADRFKSEISIDNDIQWIDLEIKATTILKDKTGTQLAVGVDESLGACISDILSANVTLGNITEFAYDGYGQFEAIITSDTAGTGELTVSIKGEKISDVINRDDLTVSSEIVIRTIPYEFIDQSVSYRKGQVDDQMVRFGPSDIAEDSNG